MGNDQEASALPCQPKEDALDRASSRPGPKHCCLCCAIARQRWKVEDPSRFADLQALGCNPMKADTDTTGQRLPERLIASWGPELRSILLGHSCIGSTQCTWDGWTASCLAESIQALAGVNADSRGDNGESRYSGGK